MSNENTKMNSNDNNGGQSEGQSANGSNEQNERLKGEPVQIADIVNEEFQLYHNKLDQILLKDSVRDRHVAVVSIAGDFRKGKSFMLNFFLRYLQSGCGAVEDWVGKNTRIPLRGFSWRGGSERDTTGIWMWSEPFIVKKSDGREVAVLVTDTQGVYDSQSQLGNSTKIFALSLLTSSTFIYNLHHTINLHDFHTFHAFGEYGVSATSDKSNHKPFQKLVFLIRDWSSPSSHPYGNNGEKGELERWLSKLKKHEKSEMKNVPKFLENCFEERMVFLMPDPGKTVRTDSKYDGNVADIEPEFVKHLEEFVPLILSPNNLLIRRISGIELTGHTLSECFKTLSNKMKGDELMRPITMGEAMQISTNQVGLKNAEQHYEKEMEKVCGGNNQYLSQNLLKATHLRIKKESLTIFDTALKTGTKEFSESYRNNLIYYLDDRFAKFEDQNNAKDIFRPYRPLAYAFLGFFICLFFYFISSASGFVALSHLFTIVGTVCICLFIAYILHWKENFYLKKKETILVVIGATLFALFFLYWRHVWHFVLVPFQSKKPQKHQTNQTQRHDL